MCPELKPGHIVGYEVNRKRAPNTAHTWIIEEIDVEVVRLADKGVVVRPMGGGKARLVSRGRLRP